jgi:hypothetical protein
MVPVAVTALVILPFVTGTVSKVKELSDDLLDKEYHEMAITKTTTSSIMIFLLFIYLS